MKRICLFFLFAGFTLCSGSAQTITTVAGTGTLGYSGDGGPAEQAMVSHVTSIGADDAGNVYFIDSDNFRIREISTSGTISTVVGNGQAGYVLNGGPATQLALAATVLGIAGDGTIYLCDLTGMKKVDLSGNLSLIPFDQSAGYPTSIAVDPSGNVYIGIPFAGIGPAYDAIYKYNPGSLPTMLAGGASLLDGGPASQSSVVLNPRSLATDSAGNIYIAEPDNNRIRKFAPGGTISTVAGNGTAGFSGDGGPATAAQLNRPDSVAVDANGNIYIAESFNFRVRRVDSSGTITTAAGAGSPLGASGDGGPASQATLQGPTAVAVDKSGNVYINDNASIRKISFP
jgi:hypothetical protein